MIKVKEYDAAGSSLVVVQEDDKVLVIGSGVVTVWNSFEDFENCDVDPLDTLWYT